MAINLLPPKYQPQPLWEIKRLVRVLLISLIILAIVFLGINYYFFRTNLVIQEANLQANIDNLQPVFTKLEGYEITLETMKRTEELAEKIGKAKEVWSDILADIAGCLTEDICFVQINKEEDQVLIEGEARNFTTVGNLAVEINKLSWFKQVDVDEAQKVRYQPPDGTGKRLTITETVQFKLTAQLLDSINLFAPSEGSDG